MPDLVLRLIGDATSGLRAVDQQILALGKLDTATTDSTRISELSAAKRVATIEKSITSQRALITSYEELKAAAVSTGRSTVAVDIAMADANAKLNRTLGVTSTGLTKTSAGAKTAENDIGKLTRGALAGSGVISSLGRSLAFASGGFIAVAGTATLLHNAITEALGFAATEKQVTAQLKTSGLSFEENKAQILDNLTAQSKLSAFTRGDLLQSFGYLVRVSGDVDQSLKLTAIAADVARGRHIALSSASIALAKALGGSSTALRRLGIIVPASAKGMDAIRYVAQKFAGQAEAGATSADHLRTSLVNAGETIGTDLLPTFNRLATEFGDWLSKMDASGKLQKDANEAITVLGYAFHALGGAIKIVDDATGGFKNTLAILIGLELGSKILSWGRALTILAGEWGLVGKAATEAGVAQSAALAETGAAGATGGAAAGLTGGYGIRGLVGGYGGGLLGSAIQRARYGRTAFSGASFAVGSGGEATGLAAGAAGVSATGVGALAVAALLATDALAGLAKQANDAAGGGSLGRNIIGGVEGVLTGGLFGNSNAGILGQVLHRDSAFRQFLSPTPPPPVNLVKPGAFGLSNASLFGPVPSGMFGTAQPMAHFWKQFEIGLKITMAQLQAALTKGTADDLAVARQIVARVKGQLSRGQLSGPALQGALTAEANALSTIWAAEAAAAQKRAAAAAAAKQKIIKQIQNAIDPINLQIAFARAEALGGNTTAVLRKQLAAAYNGLAKAIANGNKQLILQAYQQIKSIKDAIKAALTTATATFTVPAKLALDIARDQALGKGITDDLKEERRALYKWIASHRKNIQGVTDAYNQIAAINSQLNSDVVNAYGMFKKASVKALTENLGLTADQRRRLEERLSQRGPGGTTPGEGTGAAGYVIDPLTGRPVHAGHHSRNRRLQGSGGVGGGGAPVIHNVIDLTVNISGKRVEASVTENQQRRRRHNPTQTRGPNAATSVA